MNKRYNKQETTQKSCVVNKTQAITSAVKLSLLR